MDLPPGTEATLWQRIKNENDAAALQEMTVAYAGWAAAIARGIHRRVPAYDVDCDDFIQNARIGLMEAVTRYDPQRGVPFPAFAKPRVRGAVFNGLRAIIGERAPLAATGYDERLLSILEEASNDPVERVVDAIVGLGIAYLLGEPEDLSPAAYADRVCMQRRVLAQVGRLPQRQRMLIEQHYLGHRPFVEIAEDFGVTKGRVSQLHGQALKQLRGWLEESR